MMRKILVVVAVTLCGVCLPAWAAEGQEGYIGASYMNTGADFETAVETFDTDSGGWKIFGGYNFIKYFGIEATYYDLGSFDETQNNTTLSADIKVYDLSGRGILPLGKRFEVFARLGYSNVSVEATTSTPLATTTVDADDWELLYGIGLGLKLGERFGIRAEWESWDVETSLDSWSLGGYFRFGKK
jgi:hypothetical protein